MPRNLAFQIRCWLVAGLLAFTNATMAGTDDWFHREWQTDDGLSDNNVRALTQTADGYLWVATETGLSRFDGVRFHTVLLSSTGMHRENSVEKLLVDRHHRFWMAMYRGKIVCVGPDTTREYAGRLAAANPTAIVEDRAGDIWIAFNDGVATRIQNNEPANLDIADHVPADNTYCRLTRDATGRIWFSKGKYVGTFQDGKFQTLATLPRRVTRITTAGGSGIWICAGAELLQCREDGKLDKRTQLPEGAGPTAVLEDHAGVLWIGTAAHGLFRFDGVELTNIHTSQRNVSCLMEDREGNLWVGTNGGGLIRLRPRTVEVMSKDSGLPFESLRSLCRDASGALWVVTWTTEAWCQTSNGWISVLALPNWPGGGNFSCGAADPAGPVWLGSRNGGLYRLQNGTFTHWTNQTGLLNNRIQSLMVGSRGDLWVTTDSSSGSSGLQRLRGDQWHTFPLQGSPGVLRTLAEDKTGNVWIGSADGRLLRVSGDELVDETANTRSPPVSIRCLATTDDGSLADRAGGV